MPPKKVVAEEDVPVIDALQALLDEHRLTVIAVPGDGSCFFHAVAYCLRSRTPNVNDIYHYKKLRRNCVLYQLENAKDFIGFYYQERTEFTTAESVTERLRKMINTNINEWADDTEITATALMLNIRIIIHIPGKFAWNVINPDASQTIHVGYNYGVKQGHYWATKQMPDKRRILSGLYDGTYVCPIYTELLQITNIEELFTAFYNEAILTLGSSADQVSSAEERAKRKEAMNKQRLEISIADRDARTQLTLAKKDLILNKLQNEKEAAEQRARRARLQEMLIQDKADLRARRQLQKDERLAIEKEERSASKASKILELANRKEQLRKERAETRAQEENNKRELKELERQRKEDEKQKALVEKEEKSKEKEESKQKALAYKEELKQKALADKSKKEEEKSKQKDETKQKSQAEKEEKSKIKEESRQKAIADKAKRREEFERAKLDNLQKKENERLERQQHKKALELNKQAVKNASIVNLPPIYTRPDTPFVILRNSIKECLVTKQKVKFNRPDALQKDPAKNLNFWRLLCLDELILLWVNVIAPSRMYDELPVWCAYINHRPKEYKVSTKELCNQLNIIFEDLSIWTNTNSLYQTMLMERTIRVISNKLNFIQIKYDCHPEIAINQFPHTDDFRPLQWQRYPSHLYVFHRRGWSKMRSTMTLGPNITGNMHHYKLLRFLTEGSKLYVYIKDELHRWSKGDIFTPVDKPITPIVLSFWG